MIPARTDPASSSRLEPAPLGVLSVVLAVLGTVVCVAGLVLGHVASASAAVSGGAVGLGTARSYAVLAGSTVTNTGPSAVAGDLGLSPGTAVTGFPPGKVRDGSVHAADAEAAKAQADLTLAYDDAAGRDSSADETGKDLGGQTLPAGVYSASTSMALTGTLTLDAQGDPDAVFIFQAGTTLGTATDSRVVLINGTQACNVFWKVGSSATLGTRTSFKGTVMALASITAGTRAVVQGRLLARNGQVSLDTNTITRPACADAPPTTSPPTTSTSTSSPTTGPPSTGPPTTGPPTTGPPTTGGSGTSSPAPATPTIPTGHPHTGRAVLAGSSTPSATPWLLLGLLALAASGAAAAMSARTSSGRGSHRRR